MSDNQYKLFFVYGSRRARDAQKCKLKSQWDAATSGEKGNEAVARSFDKEQAGYRERIEVLEKELAEKQRYQRKALLVKQPSMFFGFTEHTPPNANSTSNGRLCNPCSGVIVRKGTGYNFQHPQRSFSTL